MKSVSMPLAIACMLLVSQNGYGMENDYSSAGALNQFSYFKEQMQRAWNNTRNFFRSEHTSSPEKSSTDSKSPNNEPHDSRVGSLKGKDVKAKSSPVLEHKASSDVILLPFTLSTQTSHNVATVTTESNGQARAAVSEQTNFSSTDNDTQDMQTTSHNDKSEPSRTTIAGGDDPKEPPMSNETQQEPAHQKGNKRAPVEWLKHFAFFSPTVIAGTVVVGWFIYLKCNKSLLEKNEEALIKFECAILDVCRALKASRFILPLNVIQLFEYYEPYMKMLSKEMVFELEHKVHLFAKAIGEACGKSSEEVAQIITPSFQELHRYIEEVCLKAIKEAMNEQYIHKSRVWSPFKGMYNYWSRKIAQMINAEDDN